MNFGRAIGIIAQDFGFVKGLRENLVEISPIAVDGAATYSHGLGSVFRGARLPRRTSQMGVFNTPLTLRAGIL